MAYPYEYYQQLDFRGGIFDQQEGASANQVIDARNVWAPNTRLVQRPGYEPVLFPVGTVANGFTAETNEKGLAEDVTGGTFIDLGSALTSAYHQVGDRVYIGGDSAWLFMYWGSGLNSVYNTAATKIKWEYWNGTEWVFAPTARVEVSAITMTSIYTPPSLTAVMPVAQQSYWLAIHGASTDRDRLCHIPPDDWAATTVNTFSRYWLRGTLLNAAMVPNTGTTITMGVPVGFTLAARCTDMAPFVLQDMSGILTLRLIGSGTSSDLCQLYIIDRPESPAGILATATLSRIANSNAVITSSVSIKEFNDYFFSFNNDVYHIDGYDVIRSGIEQTGFDSDFPEFFAKIESDPAIAGVNSDGTLAPYNEGAVPQLGAVPKAKYLAWFQNILWAAGIDSAPSQIRWTAPSDPVLRGYNVWPLLSFDELTDDFDSSPITGLSTDSEFIYVFKGDSVWRMVAMGVAPDGTALYDALKIVSGSGTKAHNSIAQLPVGNAFLSDDGVYLLTGSQVRKISDPIQNFFDTLNFNQFANAQAVHWKTQHCYLLAVPSGGSEINDTILIWDYANNGWWIWTCDIGVKSFIQLEDANDKEVIYFTNNSREIYTFGTNTDNFAAIEAYVKTTRWGWDNPTTKTFRQVRVNGSNAVASLEFEAQTDDTDTPTSGTLTMTKTDEIGLGTFELGTDTITGRRRREAKLELRDTGQWCQLKISNNETGRPLEIQAIRLGYVTEGLR